MAQTVGALVLSWLPAPPLAADLAEVLARGSLRVLAIDDRERPEFYSHAAGTRPGFDRELLEAFCRQQRLKLETVPQPGSEELLEALLDGRGDVIAGRFRVSDARRRQVAFSAETFPSRLVVITRRPGSDVTSLAQLRERTVGTIAGTVMLEELQKAGMAPQRIVPLRTGELPAALRAGRIDAAVWGVESAIAMQLEDPAVRLGIFLGSPGSIAWAVRPGDRALLRALDAHIETSRRSPAWSYLVVRYFGRAAPAILKRARGDAP